MKIARGPSGWLDNARQVWFRLGFDDKWTPRVPFRKRDPLREYRSYISVRTRLRTANHRFGY